MTTTNIWIGSQQLVIVFKKGTHWVLDSYEDYDPVFQGNYQECCDYCLTALRDYEESIIG